MTDIHRQTPVIVDLPQESIKKLDFIARQAEKSREEKARDIIISYIEEIESNSNQDM